MEFNTTSNRRVSVFADQNIKYLVNKHRPNKKTKKDTKKVKAKKKPRTLWVRRKKN